VADNSGADYAVADDAVADDAVADDAVADDAVADDAVADDAVADEEAAQKILKSKVPEVAVRSPSGQEGCVKLKNGRPFKLQVGYHEIRQFVAGADANFPHRTFYLDVRGHQTDTSLPPAHACLWKGCNGSSTYHWSIDCPEVRRQMVGHRAHDLRLCWPAPPPPPPRGSLRLELATSARRSYISPCRLVPAISTSESPASHRTSTTTRRVHAQPPRPRSSYTSPRTSCGARKHLATMACGQRGERGRGCPPRPHNREILVL
jgi:hypothetical protein